MQSLYENREKIEEEEREKQQKEEEEEYQRKVIGTPVTVESFMGWREKFEAEMGELHKKKKCESGSRLTGKTLESVYSKRLRLSGRQQFLADANLATSDLNMPDADVPIDESLFEDIDDLNFEDDEEEA